MKNDAHRISALIRPIALLLSLVSDASSSGASGYTSYGFSVTATLSFTTEQNYYDLLALSIGGLFPKGRKILPRAPYLSEIPQHS
jgi:hypothetical protein